MELLLESVKYKQDQSLRIPRSLGSLYVYKQVSRTIAFSVSETVQALQAKGLRSRITFIPG